MKPWRIGIDARFWGSRGGFGIGVYTEELLTALRQLDTSNRYLILVRKEALASVPLAENFEAVVVPFPHYSLAEQFFYPSLLRSLRLDLIHFTNFNTPIVGGLPPSLVTVHDLTLLFFPGKTRRSFWHRLGYRLVMEKGIQRAKKIIAVSEHTKNDLSRFLQVPAQKIRVIHEGISTRFKPVKDQALIDKVLRRFGISREYLLYVGQWRQHKNLINLIRAFALLKKATRLPHELVLAGGVDPRSLEILPLIKKLGLEKEIVLTGFVADEELPALYSGAALFVFPSLYEGFGFPPLEAMSCGCPVVASASASLPEVLDGAALFFDPTQAEEMAAKIHQVLSSFGLRRELREKGLKQAKKFSWRKTAQETLRLYRELLKG